MIDSLFILFDFFFTFDVRGTVSILFVCLFVLTKLREKMRKCEPKIVISLPKKMATTKEQSVKDNLFKKNKTKEKLSQCFRFPDRLWFDFIFIFFLTSSFLFYFADDGGRTAAAAPSPKEKKKKTKWKTSEKNQKKKEKRKSKKSVTASL